jgi:hypothetical protein
MEESLIQKKVLELFEKGFSTWEHLLTAKKELLR